MMRRRLTTFVLAAFYLLQATWMLHAGVDLLLPRVRVVLARAEACCTNACGCPEEARARDACCCVKGATPETAHPKVPRPVSSIEESRCKGVEAAMTQAFTQPVVCGISWISLPEAADSAVVIPELHPVFPSDSDALDKVPIAQA
jgi:hypothetical protein